MLSLGALDMVNFGSVETVPTRFKGRKLHVHNPQVTLMRTSAQENRQFAQWIASKLNVATAPVVVLIPDKVFRRSMRQVSYFMTQLQTPLCSTN